jgi:hypothetical protein
VATSPRVRLEKKFSMSSVEGQIGSKLEKKNYVNEKKKVGMSIVQVAEAARQQLMNTLKWHDGWLLFDDSVMEQERQAAAQDYISLQTKFIPHLVSLVYNVLNETAIWMKHFIEDIDQAYGRDQSYEILSKNFGVTIEETENPFLPDTWHRMALNLAIDVASDKNRIMEKLNPMEIDSFRIQMANSAAALLLCEDRKTENNRTYHSQGLK